MIDKNITNVLLDWFDKNKRVLPWRDNPTPYRVWISEIMLQQTRVQAVIPFFERFTETLPTVEALANVEDEELLKLWEGLGYYNRARNLKKAAQSIMNEFNGIVPSNKEDLESLQGIGPYTSGAVLSIAFNKKFSAVDGNVLRVFARLLEIKSDIKQPDIKKEIKQVVDNLLPNKRVGDFNQSLMEIGATICLPNGVPLCEECPIKEFCLSYQNKTQDVIPLKRKKKQVPIEKKTVLIVKHNDMFALEKRPDTGLLASMYQFPLLDGHLTKKDVSKLFTTYTKIKISKKAIHKFTHKEWDMKSYLIESEEENRYTFYPMKELKKLPIPSAFKVYKKVIEEL